MSEDSRSRATSQASDDPTRLSRDSRAPSADPPTLSTSDAGGTLRTREGRDPSPEGPEREWSYHHDADEDGGPHGGALHTTPQSAPLAMSNLIEHSAGLTLQMGSEHLLPDVSARMGIEPLPHLPTTPRDVMVRRQIGFYDGAPPLFDDLSDGDSTLSTNFTGFGAQVDLDLRGLGMDRKAAHSDVRRAAKEERRDPEEEPENAVDTTSQRLRRHLGAPPEDQRRPAGAGPLPGW